MCGECRFVDGKGSGRAGQSHLLQLENHELVIHAKRSKTLIAALPVFSSSFAGVASSYHRSNRFDKIRSCLARPRRVQRRHLEIRIMARPMNGTLFGHNFSRRWQPLMPD